MNACYFFSWQLSLLNGSGGELTAVTELQIQCACALGSAAGTDGI